MAGIRRTWDKEAYAEKAKIRAEMGDDALNVEENPKKVAKVAVREEFKPADDGAAGPMGSERAFLRARESAIDFEDKVGKIEIIKPSSDGTGPAGAGYWCEVCKCLLKDSASYLDHCNGKKHQRALGFSMRVERVGVDAVKQRLAAAKQKADEDKARESKPKPSAFEEYEERLENREREKEELKQKRKQEKLASKQAEGEKAAAEDADNDVDPEMAAMLGFSGFGSTKKK